ncbi:MAG: enoyl-CoA hydratase/isomerase family protein [Polyangiales bacterium]
MTDFHELVLSGPSKNALSSKLLAEIDRSLAAAGNKPILLRGEGDVFSAGLDLREVSALSDDETAFSFLQRLERTFVALYSHPAPVVACVNGHAIAGGCVLALCADWRIAQASARTRIGLNEVALGVEFPPSTLRIVLDRVPSHARERVLLGAGLFGVQESVSLGLVDEVSDDALTASRRKTEQLGALPAHAYAVTKRAIRATFPDSATHTATLRASLAAWTNPETRARALSVLKK